MRERLIQTVGCGRCHSSSKAGKANLVLSLAFQFYREEPIGFRVFGNDFIRDDSNLFMQIDEFVHDQVRKTVQGSQQKGKIRHYVHEIAATRNPSLPIGLSLILWDDKSKK